MMKRHAWAIAMAGVALGTAQLAPAQEAATTPRELPVATAAKLPRWRGFNLPSRMNSQAKPGSRHNEPFKEETFRLIAELGFNFTRIPTDYRHWIVDGDWLKIDEADEVLRDLDRVVAWGEQYGIHISIAFVFAPGYNVVRPSAVPSLWTDAGAQRACAHHWAMLSRRYRGISSNRLSFNLWNEPPKLEPAVHLAVVQQVVEAIRKEDPDRLIIADGRDIGKTPSPELLPLGVAQAFHCYQPGQVTHYKASWSKGSDRYPVPTWPWAVANGWLRRPGHPVQGGLPLVVQGPFPAGARLRLRVGDVFANATLVVTTDQTETWRKVFLTGPTGKGEWQKSTYLERWKDYQCRYDRDYEIPLPAGAKKLTIALPEGNWLQISEVGLRTADGPEQSLALDAMWAEAPTPVRYDATKPNAPWQTPDARGRDWLRQQFAPAWRALQHQGVGVLVEEFGVFHKTPHDVSLRWLEDALVIWQEAGWGWALWNFTGPFGILDSGRTDVQYEDWQGHKLDRKMLELLQKY
jgi:aryl-phospho-beta-D-glucosidase BglC (GH1 family)